MLGVRQLTKFQVAFAISCLLAFASHAGAGHFLFFASPKKGSKERRLRAQVWLRQTSLTPRCFSGAKRNWISCNLRLRRFKHASPYSPKNRAPFGCASRKGTTAAIDVENSVFGYERLIVKRSWTLTLIFQVACLLRKTAQSVYPVQLKFV